MQSTRTRATAEAFGRRAEASPPLHEVPFSPYDATAGSEDELQAVVIGTPTACDLPLSISESRFFRNIARRSASGEAPQRSLLELEAFLKDARDVWDNSWIRFPQRRLSHAAQQVLEADLQTVRDGRIRERCDADRYRFVQSGEPWLRIPISYALKLALADVVGTQPHLPELMHDEAERLMGHFLNDNTSPETTSFQIVGSNGGRSLGDKVSHESARRFLFATLLVSWANVKFRLLENGQRAMIYHAPLPAVHQEDLSACLSDSFYRELFMSPCLSGWSDGEAKHEYMHLCHQVLSRSQLNAVGKLREAGIIANDLIVLPSLSNVSLANNGIHITMGSRYLQAESSGQFWSAERAKYVGDLAIKIYEHFMALFVGTYSAAPHRISFSQFHPERLLSFLPHELDFTHLRLLWREWKEKARIRIFGRPLTPYGPNKLDGMVGALFRLRGDLVPDARLLTYPVAWLSTQQASALDGKAGNVQRLSLELDELGIVDRRMSLYMPLRLRERERDGYFGFEARYYSLFPSYDRDMAPAANLQQLLLAFSYRLAIQSDVTHADIPDDPTSESERRQPFFFSAAGVPAFYLHRNTRNSFLKTLARGCKTMRPSRRHPNYVRVPIGEYRQRALEHMQQSAPDLVEALQMQDTLSDLAERLRDPALQASHRLVQGAVGDNSDPMRVGARDFNHATEEFYRHSLRRQNLREGLADLRRGVEELQRATCDEVRIGLRHGVRVQDLSRFLDGVSERVCSEALEEHEIVTLLNLLLLLSANDRLRESSSPA